VSTIIASVPPGTVRFPWFPAETTTTTPHVALSQSSVRADEDTMPSNGAAGSPTERLMTNTDRAAAAIAPVAFEQLAEDAPHEVRRQYGAGEFFPVFQGVPCWCQDGSAEYRPFGGLIIKTAIAPDAYRRHRRAVPP